MSRSERVVVSCCGLVLAYFGAHLANYGESPAVAMAGSVAVLAGFLGVIAAGITGGTAE